MAETLERAAEPKRSTARSVCIFRFASTLVLWSIALGIIFSGYEIAFFILIGTIGTGMGICLGIRGGLRRSWNVF